MGHMASDSGTVIVVVSSDSGEVCGVASTMLTGAAPACLPCLESGTGSSTMASCCNASMACSNDAACLAILQCAVPCAGSVGCIDSCEALNPTGSLDFGDFARCLEQNCSPQCPNLTPGAGDI